MYFKLKKIGSKTVLFNPSMLVKIGHSSIIIIIKIPTTYIIPFQRLFYLPVMSREIDIMITVTKIEVLQIEESVVDLGHIQDLQVEVENIDPGRDQDQGIVKVDLEKKVEIGEDMNEVAPIIVVIVTGIRITTRDRIREVGQVVVVVIRTVVIRIKESLATTIVEIVLPDVSQVIVIWHIEKVVAVLWREMGKANCKIIIN